MYTFKPVLN